MRVDMLDSYHSIFQGAFEVCKAVTSEDLDDRELEEGRAIRK
jgi:hypothetical protein